ncbi:MAG: phosphate acyltransferase PlsX [Alphaproteobacteria bacterium]|nr:phosphate acyltransferase PlsX [Alphaproteobacteria bacterium]MBU1525853.1 phosphate acyltransferase PlsX [Alphaproteobacteria bacterium]MBU2350069.1 phosphate acyltransferase PlsX [Alphaproteobacteria bacterium]MBU2383185.1 phosphate acyltransferase PlsX [Alphaproteobacteria bacterium]
MPDFLTISVDAMGGDHGPSVTVPAVVAWRRRHPGADVRFLLHGDQAAIRAELDKAGDAAGAVEVRHADKVIAMDEKPAQAMRRGKGSSLWNAVEAVKTGEAMAVVSAGNTGALMAISKLILRMSAHGLERPAIVASWPNMKGGITAVLDVGANVESDAEQLVEFAIMGEAFVGAVHGVKRPTIGILNVGSEDMKGHESVREAARLLREGGFGLAYKGFVEGDDIAKGTVDVVVTDGFTGNIALKTAEGVARYIFAQFKGALTSGVMARTGALLALPALKRMRQRIDPSAINGGPLLGLNGIVVKSHGGADAKGFSNALRIAVDLARSDYLEKVGQNLTRLTAVLAAPPAAPETVGESSR